MIPAALALCCAAWVHAGELAGGVFTLSGGMTAGGQDSFGAAAASGTVADAWEGGQDRLVGGTFVGQSGNLDFSLLSRAMSNTVSASGGGLAVALPSNASPTDFDLLINMDPINKPVRVAPSLILEATAKLSAVKGLSMSPIPKGLVEINLIQDNGQFLAQDLAAPSTLRVTYIDADNDGIVDGTSPPVRVKALRIWRLDEQRRVWERVPGATVDPAAKAVSASLAHFSVYAVFGGADLDVGSVYAFPVPWSPDSGNPARGNASDGIRFTNLPSEGTIRIYTLKGELVRTLNIPPSTATLGWNVRTEGGSDVASGVYFWVAQAGTNQKSGKLMVIR